MHTALEAQMRGEIETLKECRKVSRTPSQRWMLMRTMLMIMIMIMIMMIITVMTW
jgi:F0F1-type ATP synthase membrane subunit c/vacuolar-type H+-ATPase subunit K